MRTLQRDRSLVARRLVDRWRRPDQVPGLSAWWDVSAITGLVDDDPISTLPDRSGNGHPATQTGTARPTYKTGIVNGYPVARIGSGQWMATTLTVPTESTVVYVGSGQSSGSFRRTISGPATTSNATNNWLMGPFNNLWQAAASGTLLSSGVAVTPGQFVVHAVTYVPGVSLRQWVNSTFTSTTSAITTTIREWLQISHVDQEMLGDVAEVAVWRRALTDSEVESVIRWMRGKYRI